jgi:plasmid stability protein
MTLRLDVNLDHGVIEKLKALASDHGRSVEEEAGELLRGAVLAVKPPVDSDGFGSHIVALFSGSGIGLTERESERMELRGRPVEPFSFDR